MDQFTFAALWCAVQVTIVSTLTLIVALIATRRRPDVAAQAVCGTVLVILAMTLLIPVSLPESLVLFTTSLVGPTVNHEPLRPPGPRPADSAVDASRSMSESIAGFQLNPASLLRKLTQLKPRKQLAQFRWEKYLVVGLGVGITWGLARLALGLALLHSLRRRATLIHDEAFLALAQSVRTEMGCTPRITWAVSEEVGCAAVVGFIRPTILLSSRWSSWTIEEQRSVLAHELAHVCRRDSCWRLMATVCQLVHFYNPLIRWLAGRLILAQELAADRIAMRNAGGSGSYLRSLARLALEEDARPYVRSPLSVTPVFSGHLIRRVEMLRAMDCKQDRSSRRWLSGAVLASITLFGITTTAMRGFAEADQDDQPTRSVSGNFTAIFSEAAEVTDRNFIVSVSTEPLFQREKIPATHPAFTKFGGLFLNCAALRQTHLWPVLACFFQGAAFESATKDWDLNVLDSIAFDAIWTMKAGQPEETKNQLMVGTSRIRIKANQDVDWRANVHNQFAEAVDGTKDGIDYVDVAIPAAGPLPTRILSVSPREMAVLTNHPLDKTDLSKWLNPPPEDLEHDWASEWNAVSGGVLTLAMIAQKSGETLPISEKKGAEQAKVLYESIDLLSVGIDVGPDSYALDVNIRLRCNSTADPEQALVAMQQLSAMYEGLIREEAELGADVALDPFNQMMAKAFSAAKIQLVRGESNVIECRLTCFLAPELVAEFSAELAKNNDTPAATQTAEKPDPTTKKQ